MFNRRNLLKSSVAALSSVALPSLARIESDPREVIRLGQSAPISGSQAKIGIAFRDAANAVFAESNARGTAGRTIELVTLDDEDRAERTAVNVKLLASSHDVVGLFGFVGAGAHRAGPRGAQVEGLPYIAPVSGASEIRASGAPWMYTLRASHVDELKYIARHTQQIGIERVGLVFEYNSQGWELRDTLTDMVEANKRTVAGISSIDHEGSKYSLPGAVSSILAKQPQAIILGADYVASAGFVKASRQAGFTGMFYTLSTVGGRALMDQLGQLARGISVTQVVPFPWTRASAVGRSYHAFCEQHKLDASFEGMEAYLAANLVVDAVKRLKQVSPTKLAEALDMLPERDFGGYYATLQTPRRAASARYVDLTVYSYDGKFIK
jgi:branched-chain amino acid transport system substrate-binding protein